MTGFSLEEGALPLGLIELLFTDSFLGTGQAGDPQGLPHPRKVRVDNQGLLYSKYLGKLLFYLSQVNGLSRDQYFLTIDAGIREGAEAAVLCAVSRSWVCL